MAKYSANACKENGGVFPYYIRKLGAFYQVVTRSGGRVQYSRTGGREARDACVYWIECNTPKTD